MELVHTILAASELRIGRSADALSVTSYENMAFADHRFEKWLSPLARAEIVLALLRSRADFPIPRCAGIVCLWKDRQSLCCEFWACDNAPPTEKRSSPGEIPAGIRLYPTRNFPLRRLALRRLPVLYSRRAWVTSQPCGKAA